MLDGRQIAYDTGEGAMEIWTLENVLPPQATGEGNRGAGCAERAKELSGGRQLVRRTTPGKLSKPASKLRIRWMPRCSITAR